MPTSKIFKLILLVAAFVASFIWRLDRLEHSRSLQMLPAKRAETRVNSVTAQPLPTHRNSLNASYWPEASRNNTEEDRENEPQFTDITDGYLMSLDYQSMKGSIFFDLASFITEKRLEVPDCMRKLSLFLEDKIFLDEIGQRHKSIRGAAKDIELRMNAINLLEGIAFASEIDSSRDEAIKRLKKIALFVPSTENDPLTRSIQYGDRYDAIAAITRLNPAQGMDIVDNLSEGDRAMLTPAVTLGMADLGHLQLRNFLNRVAR